MKEPKHTPEPLAYRENIDVKKREFYSHGIFDSDSRRIAIICTPRDPRDGEVLARRIVACVNACAGLSTEALEAGAIRELRRALALAKDEEARLRAALGMGMGESRHMLAAVKACEGLSTEALERGVLKEAGDALRDVISGFEDLKAEMVRLSDAKDRSASHARAEATSRARGMADRARSALAKLEGE